MSLAALGLPPYCTFTSEEIAVATNDFHPLNLIGEGSHGQVKEFSYEVLIGS